MVYKLIFWWTNRLCSLYWTDWQQQCIFLRLAVSTKKLCIGCRVFYRQPLFLLPPKSLPYSLQPPRFRDGCTRFGLLWQRHERNGLIYTLLHSSSLQTAKKHRPFSIMECGLFLLRLVIIWLLLTSATVGWVDSQKGCVSSTNSSRKIPIATIFDFEDSSQNNSWAIAFWCSSSSVVIVFASFIFDFMELLLYHLLHVNALCLEALGHKQVSNRHKLSFWLLIKAIVNAKKRKTNLAAPSVAVPSSKWSPASGRPSRASWRTR